MARDVEVPDRCLRVAIAQWPPYVIGEFPNFTGSAVEVFKIIQEKMGFCYQFVRPPDGLWGAPYPNGSWFGMMGMLQRREVDLAVGPFGVTLARSTVAAFSVPILSTDHAILYRRPQVQPDLLGFTKPFIPTVWVAVLCSLVVVTTLALLIHAILKRRMHESDLEPDGGTQDPSVEGPSPMWAYMILMAQVLRRRRRGEGEAERVVVALWMLVSLIIGVVYKSNLKAMLIIPKVGIPFDSLEELVEQDVVPWTYPRGSIVHSFFEAAHEDDPASTMGQGWARRASLLMKPSQLIPTSIGGVAGLYTRHSSFYYMGKDFSKHGVCRLAITRQGFMPVQYSMGFPRNSTLKPSVDKLIFRLNEFGLLEKHMRDEMANTSHCLQPPGSDTGADLRALAIGDFLGVLSLYAIGVVVASMVFLGEMVVGRVGTTPA